MGRTDPTASDPSGRSVHLVGIGGMGMAPLALYLQGIGYAVSGEDDALSEPVRRTLDSAGIHLVAPGAIPQAAQRVVVSSAIAQGHPARVRASQRGLAVTRRGEMLAEATVGKKLIAVVGSHGKTTTTAMLATVLKRAGFPAGYVVGGLFADSSVPPAAANGDWVVAEVDESDGTIGAFSPELTVVVNLDWDHPDFYRSPQEMEQAFAALCSRTRRAILYNTACPRSSALAAQSPELPWVSLGAEGRYQYRVAESAGRMLTLCLGGAFPLAEARVRAQGDFNAANAAAALAAADLLGAPLSADLLADFPGIRRRQSVLWESDDCLLLEDYAHHPTEIAALLEAERVSRPESRLLVAFQPHRYSRTAQYRAAFARALSSADRLFLIDVYPAGELPVPGGSTADLQAELAAGGLADRSTHLPGAAPALAAAVAAEVRPGDTLLFVGAGDIDRHAQELAQVFAQQPSASSEQAMAQLAAQLRGDLSAESRLLENELLAKKTTLRVGGAARLYAEPASQEDLVLLMRRSAAAGVPSFLLGRGSNLLVPDEGVAGLVVRLQHPYWQRFEILPENRVRVGAGLRLKELCGQACRAGLSGFEFLEGIPGTVGGALRMNAGAMGGWMFDVVEEVELLDRSGEVRRLAKGDLHVRYRECRELVEAVALSAVLRPARREEAEAIRATVAGYQARRHETQPREPSAGCIFKNPEGYSAGQLIDELGLKGSSVGEAEVSRVHGNFIINRGGARCADVLELIRRVRACIRQERGIDLEPEVLLFGREWKDVL